MNPIKVNVLTGDEYDAVAGPKVSCADASEDAGHLACILGSGTILGVAMPVGAAVGSAAQAFEFANGTLLCVAFGYACLIEGRSCSLISAEPVAHVALGKSLVALADSTEITIIQDGVAWTSPRVSYDGIQDLLVNDLLGTVEAQGYSAPEGGMVPISILVANRRVVDVAYP